MEGVLPDVFVRRADEDRITNSMSDRLLDSRLTRLERGRQLLRQRGTSEQQKVWEGQYFIEAEFLLFNVPNSDKRQTDVLRSWRNSWRPSIIASLTVAIYFCVARWTRNHCYLVLRIARRIAMKILPAAYFSGSGGFFESEAASASILEKLRLKFSESENSWN
jgi:hypothetical protein